MLCCCYIPEFVGEPETLEPTWSKDKHDQKNLLREINMGRKISERQENNEFGYLCKVPVEC
jgi:hypothetical protein